MTVTLATLAVAIIIALGFFIWTCYRDVKRYDEWLQRFDQSAHTANCGTGDGHGPTRRAAHPQRRRSHAARVVVVTPTSQGGGSDVGWGSRGPSG